MHKVYINIGSNQGDRETAIGRAVALIEHLCGSPARRSPIIESDPWGYESSNRFMNMGIVIMTSMPPEKMLKIGRAHV
nr:2-amino-4-hydroxy-6-hydroxymethyldihydropteridine diphosphokinase [uncultured Muribaculum sp.]